RSRRRLDHVHHARPSRARPPVSTTRPPAARHSCPARADRCERRVMSAQNPSFRNGGATNRVPMDATRASHPSTCCAPHTPGPARRPAPVPSSGPLPRSPPAPHVHSPRASPTQPTRPPCAQPPTALPARLTPASTPARPPPPMCPAPAPPPLSPRAPHVHSPRARSTRVSPQRRLALDQAGPEADVAAGGAGVGDLLLEQCEGGATHQVGRLRDGGQG